MSNSNAAQIPNPHSPTISQAPSKRKKTRPALRTRPSYQTPKDYAYEVEKLAHRATAATLYPGSHFEKLATFLNTPYRSARRAINASLSDGSDEKSTVTGYITSYDLGPNISPSIHNITTLEELETKACGPYDPEVTGRLLFLQGHQPAEWLNQLGARYGVDCEFFRRHMDFDSLKRTPDTFVRRNVSSDFSRMFHMSVATLGSRHTPEDAMTRWYQGDIGGMCRRLETFVQTNFGNIVNPHKYEGSYGESFVRRLTIHDGQFFSLEQDISVFVGDTSGGWIVIVWSDFGQDLCRETLAGVLHCEPDDVRSLPTIQHLTKAGPFAAKNSWSRPRNVHRTSSGVEATMSQNVSSLAVNYGVCLDNDLMAADPFYLLTELFRLSIASEAEFLEMMQAVLGRELDMSTDESKNIRKTLALLHLDYNRGCLLRHVSQLERLHSFVKARADLEWPCAEFLSGPESNELRGKASKAVAALERDFDGLIRDARMLSESFNAGMNLLMNSAMTDESQRAIAQAERVEKLTALAFFFIPLSFVASVFGMNFLEFTGPEGSKLHIWVWILASLSVTALAYCFLNSTARGLWKKAFSLIRKKEKVTVDAV